MGADEAVFKTVDALFTAVTAHDVKLLSECGDALVYALNRKLQSALDRATPLLERATTTLGRVEETTVQLQQRVDHVLEKTTALVDQISERVDTTTAIAEEAVTEPLIGAASIMAGISRGFRVYTERSSEKGDGGNG